MGALNIQKKHLWFLLILIILLTVTGFVIAYTTDSSGTPNIMGHSADELEGTYVETYVESTPMVWSTSIKTFNHGMGVRPKKFGAYIEVIAARLGFAVGDRIVLASEDGDGGRHMSIWANTASVNMIVNSNLIVRRPDGGSDYLSYSQYYRIVLWAEN